MFRRLCVQLFSLNIVYKPASVDGKESKSVVPNPNNDAL